MSDQCHSSGVSSLLVAIIPSISAWYEDHRHENEIVSANVMCAGLYVTYYLSQSFPLRDSDYLTKSQVKGAGGGRVRSILSDHGEVRPFLSEGGRNPGQALFDNRCRANLAHNYRPWILVPEDKLLAARQLAELAELGYRIAVQAIEDFVGTNVEEMAVFTASRIRSGLRALLECYNERVHAVEPDPSLLIEIPANL